MFKVRPYQQKSEDAVFQEWENGARCTLLVLPTATGKTVVFSNIIKRINKRALILVHRIELAFQAIEKIRNITGMSVGLEMGGYKASTDRNLFHPHDQVVVAGVQTMYMGGDGGGRMTKFNPMDFDLVIIDEAHHYVSPSYKKVVDYFLTNPKLVICGVTATPDRSSEEALGQLFETVAFDYEILDAIKDGWLCPVDQQSINIESLDFSSIRTTAGDLNGADLAAVMESEKNLHGIASSTIDIAGSRRGIGFAASVHQAQMMCDIFNRHRSGSAAFISGKTDKEERKKINSDFARGEIQWIWNCGTHTEGFDDSGVEIIVPKPTKSRSLFAQMCGRAMRPHDSIAHKLNDCGASALRRGMIQRSIKPSCLILDHYGNSGKHKLCCPADILGGNVSDEVLEAAVKAARQAGGRVRMDKTIEEEEKKLEERKQRELEDQARKAKLVAKAKFSSKSINPFNIFDIKPAQPRGWDSNKPVSEGMARVMRKMGINPDDFTYTQARQLVSAQIDRWNKNLCSLKQAKLLKQFGYETSVTFEKASEIISSIKAAGWRRPAEQPNKIKIPSRPATVDQTINSDEPF